MASHNIVEKLNRLLDGRIDSEAKAVYLLCEVRKLLERTPPARQPFALKMYCHWALHVDLDREGTTKAFVQQVDDYVHGKVVGPEDILADRRMVQDFLLLRTFRTQLHEFAIAAGIRTDLTDSDERWVEFVGHYAGIIDEGSVAIAGGCRGLRHVRKITFTKGQTATGEFNQLPFEMMWRVDLIQGGHAQVEISGRAARDGVGPMTAWGFRLHQ